MKLKEVVKFIIYFVVLVVLVVVIRKFVLSPITVNGDSMMPNLVDGERVISLKFGDIERFDIVAFPAPDQEDTNYIKRVIGLPGDKIEYRDDVLYVNDKKMDEPYLNEYKSELTDDYPLTLDFNFETLAEGYTVDPTTAITSTNEGFEGATTVPDGKLFVMGDNRRISKDSRIIGFIDEDSIIGDVKFVFWPLNRLGTVD